MSMFVFLNNTLQVLQKISTAKQHIIQQKNITINAISIISLFLFGSIWFTSYYCLNRFLYMYKISQLTEQNMYVQVTYRNPMFCTYILYKRHGQFFGSRSRIFFLNSVRDTIFLIPSVKCPIFFVPN